MNEQAEQERTVSRAGFIGLAAFGGAVAGFFLQLIVAYHFGASASTDAFFMAQSTSELLSKLLLGGSITAVFLPMFVERIASGNADEAWQLGLNILHMFALVLILTITLLGIFAPAFVHFVAPGFDPATTTLTVNLLRVLLPSFLFLFLVDMATAMLHALKHFAVPASLRIVAPLASILVLLLAINTLGIYALAVGSLLGSALQFALVLWALNRKGFRYRWVLAPRHPHLRQLVRLVYPFILSVLVTQGAGIVYRILVSELTPGSLSALRYAEKITQLLTIMFLGSVTIAIYPLLSEKASRRDFVGIRTTIAAAVRLISFITIPIIIGVAVLREPLVTLLFQRGSFEAQDTAMTSLALVYIVIGLTTNGISSVLGHATLALQQTRAAVAVTIASQAVSVALFILLVPILGHAGLALAASLVPLVITLLYFLYLTQFVPRLHLIFWHSVFIKIGILASLLLVCVVSIERMMRSLPLPHDASLLMRLVVPSVAGGLLYFSAAYMWRIQEMHDVWRIAQATVRKWRR